MELNHYGYANHCHLGLTHIESSKILEHTFFCVAGLAGLAPALDP